MGTVYFFKVEQQDVYKIGYTNGDVYKRLSQVQTGCPWPLFLFATIGTPNAKEVEKSIHAEVQQFRLQGEFFGISEPAIKAVIEKYSRLYDRGKMLIELDSDRARFLYSFETSMLYVRSKDIVHKSVEALVGFAMLASNRNLFIDGDWYVDYEEMLEMIRHDVSLFDDLVSYKAKLIAHAHDFAAKWNGAGLPA